MGVGKAQNIKHFVEGNNVKLDCDWDILHMI